MRNSNPNVLNHSNENEVLATNFYSQCFSKGAIRNTGDAVVMDSLNEGVDRQGGYLVPDTSRFMPKLVAGAKAIAFGDVSAYWIADRDNRSLRRYNELFAIEDKLGFQMTERVDGRLMIPEAVKVLQIAE